MKIKANRGHTLELRLLMEDDCSERFYLMCIFVMIIMVCIVYMFTLVLDVSVESCDLVGYYSYYILLVYDHLYPLQDCMC